MQPEALEELAASIKAQGLMQPVVVRALGGSRDGFDVTALEYRWRPCRLRGIEEVPGSTRDAPDDAAFAMALIENIQREAVNPVEEGIARYRLLHEFGLTQME